MAPKKHGSNSKKKTTVEEISASSLVDDAAKKHLLAALIAEAFELGGGEPGSRATATNVSKKKPMESEAEGGAGVEEGGEENDELGFQIQQTVENALDSDEGVSRLLLLRKEQQAAAKQLQARDKEARKKRQQRRLAHSSEDDEDEANTTENGIDDSEEEEDGNQREDAQHWTQRKLEKIHQSAIQEQMYHLTAQEKMELERRQQREGPEGGRELWQARGAAIALFEGESEEEQKDLAAARRRVRELELQRLEARNKEILFQGRGEGGGTTAGGPEAEEAAANGEGDTEYMLLEDDEVNDILNELMAQDEHLWDGGLVETEGGATTAEESRALRIMLASSPSKMAAAAPSSSPHSTASPSSATSSAAVNARGDKRYEGRLLPMRTNNSTHSPLKPSPPRGGGAVNDDNLGSPNSRKGGKAQLQIRREGGKFLWKCEVCHSENELADVVHNIRRRKKNSKSGAPQLQNGGASSLVALEEQDEYFLKCKICECRPSTY